MKKYLVVLFVVTALIGIILGAGIKTSSFSKDHWGWTIGVAWISANKNPDVNVDGWLYMAKIGKSVFTFETRLGEGIYAIHYDLGNGEGWKSFLEPNEELDFPVGIT